MDLEYKRKLAAAFAELEAAGIPRDKYNPFYCRVSHRLGCSIRPLYYMNIWCVPIVEATGKLFETVIIFTAVNIFMTLILEWPYEGGIISAIISSQSNFLFNNRVIFTALGVTLILGYCAIFSVSEARRKHQLSRWEEL